MRQAVELSEATYERTNERANDGIRMLEAARARERRVRACAALDNCGRPGSQHALPNLSSHGHGGGVIQGPHFHISLSRFEDMNMQVENVVQGLGVAYDIYLLGRLSARGML